MGDEPTEQRPADGLPDAVDELDRDFVSAEEAMGLLGLTRLELFRRLRLNQIDALRHVADRGWYLPRSALPGLGAGSWWAAYGTPHETPDAGPPASSDGPPG